MIERSRPVAFGSLAPYGLTLPITRRLPSV
jgi:hypothetical protein